MAVILKSYFKFRIFGLQLTKIKTKNNHLQVSNGHIWSFPNAETLYLIIRYATHVLHRFQCDITFCFYFFNFISNNRNRPKNWSVGFKIPNKYFSAQTNRPTKIIHLPNWPMNNSRFLFTYICWKNAFSNIQNQNHCRCGHKRTCLFLVKQALKWRRTHTLLLSWDGRPRTIPITIILKSLSLTKTI